MSYEFYDTLLDRVEDLQKAINKLRNLVKNRVQELRRT